MSHRTMSWIRTTLGLCITSVLLSCSGGGSSGADYPILMTTYSGMYTVNSDESGMTEVITPGGQPSVFAFAADGSRLIVGVVDETGVRRTYAMSPDGGDAVLLALEGFESNLTSLSDDGSRAAGVARAPGTQEQVLTVVATDGSGSRAVATYPPDFNPTEIRFSRDGKRLVYLTGATSNSDPLQKIVSVDIETGVAQEAIPSGYGAHNLLLAPDGKTYYFLASSPSGLFSIGADGSGEIALDAGTIASAVQMSHDGSFFVYVSDIGANGQVSKLSATGGPPEVLVMNGTAAGVGALSFDDRAMLNRSTDVNRGTPLLIFSDLETGKSRIILRDIIEDNSFAAFLP